MVRPRSALAVWTVLAAAACGSGGGSEPSHVDPSLIARVEAICQSAVVEHDQGTFPVTGFDPLHPNPRDLPAVGRYLAKYGGLGAIAQRTDAIVAPSGLTADWGKLQKALDQAAANAQQQIAAAKRSDVAAFVRTVRTTDSLSERVDELGARLGFTDSSPCHKVFG